MMINTEAILSVSEANQNFSRATRIADKYGEVVILKQNKPKYALINIEKEPLLTLTEDEKIEIVAKRVLQRYLPAFKELAK